MHPTESCCFELGRSQVHQSSLVRLAIECAVLFPSWKRYAFQKVVYLCGNERAEMSQSLCRTTLRSHSRRPTTLLPPLLLLQQLTVMIVSPCFAA